MICAKCHHERPSGREYRFYYGHKGPSSTYRDFDRMQKVTSTSYTIAGQAAAWVCDRCVTVRQSLYLSGLLLVAGMFALNAYASAQEGNTANLYACSGIALLFAGVGVYAVLTGRAEMGEMVAISARKKDLRGQGHNAFFTTKRYESLRRTNS
jgi:hypothetical protein